MSRTSDYRQELTNTIIEMLEKGTAPWVKPWDGRGTEPENASTGKQYRGINNIALTITAERNGYTDPRWATFKQAKDNGWSINAGSKGTPVEFWVWHEKQNKLDENGKPILDEKGNNIKVDVKLDKPKVIRSVVFNANQITGMPPLEKKSYEWEPMAEAEKILTNSGAKITHSSTDRAYYSPTLDSINLPLKEQFENQGNYYATALHEVGHWTGHSSRLNRDLTGSFGTESYAKEELRAELSSYFVSNRLGIEHDPSKHASYIGSWIKVLKEDKNEIFRAAADAEKITDYVLSFQKEKELSQTQAKEQTKDAIIQESKAPNMAVADVRLMVNIKEKDAAKELGAKWDKDLKTWYAPKGTDLNNFSNFMGEKVVNLRDVKLHVDYNERDKVRQHGAWWDNDNKSWVMKAGSDIKNIPNNYFLENNQVKAVTYEMSFEDFARSKALIIEDKAIADGKIHRVPVEGGKPKALDGAYKYFDDANGQAGWIKNFKTGYEGTYGKGQEHYFSNNSTTTFDKEARAVEREADYKEAAKKANYLVNKVFKEAKEHPYLDNKGIKPHGALVDKDNTLIIPLKDIDGKVTTFQRITADGEKGYMGGGKQTGSSFTFGVTPKDNVIIAEGFSTAASIYEASGITTVAAMQSTNLKTVAESLRTKYGDSINIYVAADNDHKVEREQGVNPGVKFATEAAKAVNGKVIVPTLSDKEKTLNMTDFNDLAKQNGKEYIRDIITQHVPELKKSREQSLER